MLRLRVPLAVPIGAVFACTPFALATEQAPKMLQQCAAMLPAGKVYNFQMTGTIEMTGGAPEVRGNMAVDDGTQIDRTREYDGQLFAKCIAAFLG